MKKLKRNIISVTLMWLSQLVLLLFMGFWLHKVYQEQYHWLQTQTKNIFVHTTRDLQDALLERLISGEVDVEHGDTTVLSVYSHHSRSALKYEGHIPLKIDDLHHGMLADSVEARQIKVMLTADMEDALPEMISSVVMNFSTSDSLSGSILKIQSDSLRVDTLRQYYREALADSEIDLPFSLTSTDSDEHFGSTEGIVTPATKAGFPNSKYYQASFSKYGWYLFQKMLPHSLFSLFLISLTSISFFLIYQNLKRQQRLTELKNDFIRNITHELKTPVTTVGVAIEALHNFDALDNPARTKEYLDISRSELNRLSLLIDKVLRMAVFEKKGVEMKLETFDFKALVEEILASMRLQFQKQNAEVSFSTSGENFMLEADRIHITSVIYNLVDNALKYSHENPVIELDLKKSATHLTIAIKDNGIGISPEFKEKIFEKFFRVPTGDQHNTKGYGLGLSYVASVVRNHLGKIEVESEIGKGSCFLLTLPNRHG